MLGEGNQMFLSSACPLKHVINMDRQRDSYCFLFCMPRHTSTWNLP